jgi:hypothetical protein
MKTTGPASIIYFVLVIFIGAFFVINIVLAVVESTYTDSVLEQDQGEKEQERERACDRSVQRIERQLLSSVALHQVHSRPSGDARLGSSHDGPNLALPAPAPAPALSQSPSTPWPAAATTDAVVSNADFVGAADHGATGGGGGGGDADRDPTNGRSPPSAGAIGWKVLAAYITSKSAAQAAKRASISIPVAGSSSGGGGNGRGVGVGSDGSGGGGGGGRGVGVGSSGGGGGDGGVSQPVRRCSSVALLDSVQAFLQVGAADSGGGGGALDNRDDADVGDQDEDGEDLYLPMETAIAIAVAALSLDDSGDDDESEFGHGGTGGSSTRDGRKRDGAMVGLRGAERSKLQKFVETKLFVGMVMVGIGANTVVMAVWRADMSARQVRTLDGFNLVFTLFFTLEMAMKMQAHVTNSSYRNRACLPRSLAMGGYCK